jgi:hypothetical protein
MEVDEKEFSAEELEILIAGVKKHPSVFNRIFLVLDRRSVCLHEGIPFDLPSEFHAVAEQCFQDYHLDQSAQYFADDWEDGLITLT